MRNMFFKRCLILVILLSMGTTILFADVKRPIFGGKAYNAKNNADRDARANTSSTLWYFGGLIMGVWAVGAAYIIEPIPKARVLIGKSPQYVAVYNDEYKSVSKNIQKRYAWAGCITGGVLYITYYLLIVYYSTPAYSY